MNRSTAIQLLENPDRSILRALIVCVIFWLAAMAAAVYLRRLQFVGFIAIAPLVVAVVASPRLALYQFVFCCFIWYPVLPQVPILLVDLSAALVLLAAVFDVLLNERLPGRIPSVGLYYGLLLLALTIAAVFSFDPGRAIRPVARIFLLGSTFLAIYRLSAHVSLDRLLRIFFWIGAGHAVIALVPFVLSGGVYRSFGFSKVVLDDLAMVLLPVGVTLFLWSSRRASVLYMAATIAALGALVGTQSRAPIAMGLTASAVVLVLSRSRLLTLSETARRQVFRFQNVQRRVFGWVGLVVAVIVAAVVVQPTLFTTVLDRFSNLFTLQPSETFSFRLYLWGQALSSFADHPLLGIGPGMFRVIGEVYPTSHLHPAALHLRGLSAHNTLLHYMAEAGALGGLSVLILAGGQFRLSLKAWRSAWSQANPGLSMAILVIGGMFLLTTLVEAGWLWGGQISYLGCLLLALVSRAYRSSLST